MVHDLNTLPLPFDDAQFDEVNCKDVLEHIDYVPLLRELHRVMAPGGRLVVESPHFTRRAVYIDPTHRTRSRSTRSLLRRDGKFGSRSYYFDFHFERIESARSSSTASAGSRGTTWSSRSSTAPAAPGVLGGDGAGAAVPGGERRVRARSADPLEQGERPRGGRAPR